MRARDALREAMGKYWHLLLGIAVLIYFLVIRMPPGIAALFSALALLALDSVNRLVRGRADLPRALKGVGRMIVQGLEEGGRTGAQVAIVIAVISILIEILAVTGFAQKLSNTMLELSGGNLSLLMVIAAGTCLAFGLGLPTSAAYILVALLGAPALADLGVPLLAAHFFVFYFANMSGITPPVAVTALVGANIAQARFLPTALLSVRLGLPGFLLPFLFVARPEILGIDAGLAQQVMVTLLALVAVMALNIILEGYFLAPMALWERLLLLPAAFGLLHHRWETTAVGLVLLLIVVAYQGLAARRRKTGRAGTATGRG